MASPRLETDEIKLSRREMEIARLVAEGLTNREIAARLFLSERTVDGHLEHVREKLAVNTRAQVAAWVVRQKEAPLPSVQPAPRRSFRWRAIPRQWLWAAAVVLVAAEAAVVIGVIEPPGPTIVTVAGSPLPAGFQPVGGFTGDRGRAVGTLLSLPSDVAVAGDGSIYIADYRNERIRVVLNGTIDTVAGGGQEDLVDGSVGTSVDITHTSNIALDSTGQPYFLSNLNGVIEVWRLEQNRTVTRVMTVRQSDIEFGGWWPFPLGGLAIGPDGTIYVAERSGNRVFRFRRGDSRPTPFAGTGEGGFKGDGAAATGAKLWSPGGLAVDAKGNVYIADAVNNRIRKVSPDGVITTVAGSGTHYGDSGDGGKATDAQLHSPFGVAVARDGTIYIADTGNNRIRKVTPTGIILAVAGTGFPGFAGDGRSAEDAQLAAPEGIALDGKGNLFIADTVNLRIREVIGVDK